MSSTIPTPESAAHSCEHCSTGGGAATDPAAQAREHVALARRRLVPRLALGVLGLGVAVVMAVRQDQPALLASAVFVVAALAWLAAAWGGMVLGAALAARRGPWVRLALGQVLAAGIAPLLALGIALGLAATGHPTWAAVAGGELTARLAAGTPYAVAAAAGWFLAAGIAEAVRLRATRAAVERQDEAGMRARAEALTLTPRATQRAETIVLGVALAFGAALLVLTLVPWAAVVLAPLAAAGAALVALRANGGGASGAAATQRDS